MQNFKGDSDELKMQSVVTPLLSVTDLGLDDFYERGFDANPFILMLRDEGRIPFSIKLKEEFFPAFFSEALKNFPFVGNFESYLLILKAVFGEQTEIIFEVPAPGKLTILVNFSQSEFDLIGRIFNGVSYDLYQVISDQDEIVICNGLTGIETVEELYLLFSEITPEGIFLTLALNAFEKFEFVVDHTDLNVYEIKDHEDNLLYFLEPV